MLRCGGSCRARFGRNARRDFFSHNHTGAPSICQAELARISRGGIDIGRGQWHGQLRLTHGRVSRTQKLDAAKRMAYAHHIPA